MRNVTYLAILLLLWITILVCAEDLSILRELQYSTVQPGIQVNSNVNPDHIKPKYIHNEIIVKFKKTLADKVHSKLLQGGQIQDIILSDSLDKLNSKFRIKRIKPLFKNFKTERQYQNSILQKDVTLLTEREKHITKRLKRRPNNAKTPDLDRIYKIQIELRPGQSLEDAIAAYEEDPSVEYAELNYIVSIDTTPNDPLYSNQWSLDKIDTSDAWDINTGNSEVIVAVLDSGIDYNHRDINDNLWINEAELTGIEGVDDDENGYIDDIYGYDFINNDSDPKDDLGHGTHCAGIIAAESNNGLDIAGVSWNSKVMTLKFINENGDGSISAAAEALYYAIENGADIISNSWGIPGVFYNECESIKEAIEYAYSQGVIVIAAAGNDSWQFPELPAYYEHVIGVAATDPNDEKADFSNFGDWVDIAAPGVDILSLRAEGTYLGTPYDDYTTFMSGTSMACPLVAGGCALILSNCSNISIDIIEQILEESTDSISPEFYGFGRLNIYKALKGLSAGVVRFDRDSYPCSAIPVTISVRDLDLMGGGIQNVVISTNAGDSETITLIESSLLPGVFTVTIPISSGEPNTEDGIIQATHGHVMTVKYEDVHDGMGNPSIVEDTAVIDCVSPIIFNVLLEMRGVAAKITFETDEPTTGRILCGSVCGDLCSIVAEDYTLSTIHEILLLNMTNETDYYFIVDANDAADNHTINDNNGVCYFFTTTLPFMLRVPGEYSTIQEAIDQAWDHIDTVLVANGTYTGEGNCDVDFRGKSITVRSENGPENSIIDCQGSISNKHRGFVFHSGESIDSVIDGFTITNGYGPEEELISPIGIGIHSVGGAIYCKKSSPKISNCIIRVNQCGYKGGGIYAQNLSEPFDYSSPIIIDCNICENQSQYGGGLCSCNGPIINCTISRNSAGTFGGGANIAGSGGGLYDCRGKIDNCTITDNLVSFSGGGLNNCFGPISNCIISGNHADYSGGGLEYCLGSISNCVISGNSSGRGGGGLSRCSYGPITNCLIINNSTAGSKGGGGLYECNSELINCTIVNNSASKGGGIYDTASTAIPYGWPKPPAITPVINCIIWGNEASMGSQIYLDYRGGIDVNNCDVQGGEADVYIGLESRFDWKTGNIDADPLFVDATNNNYYLQSDSPCIDAGDSTAILPSVTTDLNGNPRIIDNCVDMGVYEFFPEDLTSDGNVGMNDLGKFNHYLIMGKVNGKPIKKHWE